MVYRFGHDELTASETRCLVKMTGVPIFFADLQVRRIKSAEAVDIKIQKPRRVDRESDLRAILRIDEYKRILTSVTSSLGYTVTSIKPMQDEHTRWRYSRRGNKTHATLTSQSSEDCKPNISQLAAAIFPGALCMTIFTEFEGNIRCNKRPCLLSL
jgi:hypothetical protein